MMPRGTDEMPYCQSEAVLKDTSEIYKSGVSYGLAWICSNYPECDSYVGCHKGTANPLGRMANKELRTAKSAAHIAFDRLWKEKMRLDKCSKGRARGAGYEWLSKVTGIPAGECHIGMMDADRCLQVVRACQNTKASMADDK